MHRKTRVPTFRFQQLSLSQLLKAECRILPHCAHVADMNFYFEYPLGYPSEPASADVSSDPQPSLLTFLSEIILKFSSEKKINFKPPT